MTKIHTFNIEELLRRNIMRFAVIGDIHGNKYALESVLKDIEDKDVDFIFSTGDLVGYMPYPNQVIDLIREHKICSVQGNHDRAIANGNKVGEEITCTIEKVEYNSTQLIEDTNKNRMISDALVQMLTKGI